MASVDEDCRYGWCCTKLSAAHPA